MRIDGQHLRMTENRENHSWNSDIQFSRVLSGAITNTGPQTPASRRKAKRPITWSVFPSPISSASMPCEPFSKSFRIQLMPCSWWGKSLISSGESNPLAMDECLGLFNDCVCIGLRLDLALHFLHEGHRLVHQQGHVLLIDLSTLNRPLLGLHIRFSGVSFLLGPLLQIRRVPDSNSELVVNRFVSPLARCFLLFFLWRFWLSRS